MIPREVLKRLRKVEIAAKKLVHSTLQGNYLSAFKGKGIEFDEVREYADGDDIRSIDWNVTARLDKPYVKKFIEEREMVVLLLIDLSGSLDFGTQKQLKKDLALDFCSCVAFSALQNNDRVGLVLFTDKVEKFIPPRKGRKHVMRILRELLFFKPKNKTTCIDAALSFAQHLLKKHSTLFLVSDFMDPFLNKKKIKRTSRKHDLVSVILKDKLEEMLPALGLMRLEDPETGKTRLVDTSSKRVLEYLKHQHDQRMRKIEGLFTSSGVDFIPLYTGQDPIKPLIRFFRARERIA